jgi:hypothetical protein
MGSREELFGMDEVIPLHRIRLKMITLNGIRWALESPIRSTRVAWRTSVCGSDQNGFSSSQEFVECCDHSAGLIGQETMSEMSSPIIEFQSKMTILPENS